MKNIKSRVYDYIINIPNKLFFPLFKKNKKINHVFRKFGFIHHKQVLENKNFAREIHEGLKNLNLKKIIKKEIKKKQTRYIIHLNKHLDKKIKIKIKNFFDNPEKIYQISSMLGCRVKFRKYILQVNFYNNKTIESEGAKMFHRDSDSLQDQVKIFMLINDIDDHNGMFYFIPKTLIDEDYRLPYESDRMSMELINKWRNYDKTILSYLKNKNKKYSAIKKLYGIQGEILYIDTGKLYHKGGYISDPNKKRILLQVIYTPILGLSNWADNQDNLLLKFLQHKLTSLKIKLRTKIKI